MTDLSPETLAAVGDMYRAAGTVFGSLDVYWWVSLEPGPFGPEIAFNVRAEVQRWRFVITQAAIRNGDAGLRGMTSRLRLVRERMRRGEVANLPGTADNPVIIRGDE